MTSRMQTRSTAAKKAEEDLAYSMQDALSQLKTEVEKVCAANDRTEKKVESLKGYFEITEASLLSSVYMLYS